MELKIGDIARVSGYAYKFVKLVEIDVENDSGVLLYFNQKQIGHRLRFSLRDILEHFKEYKCSGPWIVKYKGV